MSSYQPQPFADPTEERIIRRIPFEIAGLAALLGLGAALLFDPLTGAVFAGGGFLSALSFLWLKRALVSVLGRERSRALRAGILLYALRFLLILGVFVLIILLIPAKLIAFAAGFSTVIPVFLVETVLALARFRSVQP